MTIRLRPGDGKLLRARARVRDMNYSTYVSLLIRAHLRANPPMPLDELARFERGLAQLSAMLRGMAELGLPLREGKDLDPLLVLGITTICNAVDELKKMLREVVKANRISWESADAEVRL